MRAEDQVSAQPPSPASGARLFGRALARYGSASALIGIGIQIFNSLDQPTALHPRALAAGALLGFLLCAGSLVCEAALVRPFHAPGRDRALPLQAAAYFLGGVFGCAAAIVLAERLLDYRLLAESPSLAFTLVVFGGLSAVIGLTFATIGRLRYRLERSVAELKEREFAAKELETAREIQQRLLPAPDSSGDGYRIAARNRAARMVGGDFYDVVRLGDGSLGLAVADVAGKGLGAALIMASVKAALPLVAAERGVAAALGELNRRLTAELGRREFVALVYARFEPASGRLELANAGLPDPLLWSAGGPRRELATPGERLPLGLRPSIEYTSVTVELAPGERLLIYTDGLVEVRDRAGGPSDGPPADDLLGFDGLHALLDELAPIGVGEPGRFLDELMGRIEDHGGGTLDDDCTALLLERAPMPSLSAPRPSRSEAVDARPASSRGERDAP